MITVLVFVYIVKICNGFLLGSSNTSLPVKQTYLTVAEYYGDRNRLHGELESYHNQLENYRNQQDSALILLANQLQQRLVAMEQTINEKNISHYQYVNLVEQKFTELEKQNSVTKETVKNWEHKYQELEENYNGLAQTLRTLKNQNQIFLLNNTKQQSEIDNLKASMKNNTNELNQEIQQLKQLKNVNQLQSLSKLADKVQTFDSRISLLSGHEQSRNQDFLALYNLSTSTSNRLKHMEAEHNASLLALQLEEKKTRYDFGNRLDLLSRNQNLSLAQLQQTIEQKTKEPKRFAFSATLSTTPGSKSAESILIFDNVSTNVGSAYSGVTGKFTCGDGGLHFFSWTTVVSDPPNDFGTFLAVNGNKIAGNGVSNGLPSGDLSSSSTVVVNLQKGDSVWIVIRDEGSYVVRTWYSVPATMFSGFKMN